MLITFSVKVKLQRGICFVNTRPYRKRANRSEIEKKERKTKKKIQHDAKKRSSL